MSCKESSARVAKEFRTLLIRMERLLPPRDNAISKNSPRYRSFMAPGRSLIPHRSSVANYWIYIFFSFLLVFLIGISLFQSSSLQSKAPATTILNADTAAHVHVAYLYLKIADLQEKVLKASTAIQESSIISNSLAAVIADLTAERTRSRNVLAEITDGLDGIAKLLTELKTLTSSNDVASQAETDALKPSDIVQSNMSKGEKEMITPEVTNHSPETSLSDPFHDFFDREETNKYIKARGTRDGSKNFMGVNATYGAVGLACVTNKVLLDKYMDYDIGDVCRDDWVIGQQLIIRGCEPLPRRRCRARGPIRYQKPLPAKESLWAIPSNDNIRWENYFCQNFSCLADYEHRKKFFKCSPCFDLQTLERQRWVVPNSTDAEYLIADVLALKPEEIRIGLDYSMGTGTFAARMKEHDVTIVSTTLNLGAPFSETIALRGLVPLYISINQRLPFFDNTLDIVHTTLFLDAWIDHQLLDFILFDFDRVLRPGGLLWLDRFFCHREELAEYLFYFKRLRYKAHMWVTTPKMDKFRNEVYFSAVWEKPLVPFEDFNE